MATKLKAQIALSIKTVRQQGGLVVLPVAEYQKLLARAVPTYYLTGQAAKQLDRRVAAALKEYRAGKTKKIKSLADFD